LLIIFSILNDLQISDFVFMHNVYIFALYFLINNIHKFLLPVEAVSKYCTKMSNFKRKHIYIKIPTQSVDRVG